MFAYLFAWLFGPIEDEPTEQPDWWSELVSAKAGLTRDWTPKGLRQSCGCHLYFWSDYYSRCLHCHPVGEQIERHFDIGGEG